MVSTRIDDHRVRAEGCHALRFGAGRRRDPHGHATDAAALNHDRSRHMTVTYPLSYRREAPEQEFGEKPMSKAGSTRASPKHDQVNETAL